MTVDDSVALLRGLRSIAEESDSSLRETILGLEGRGAPVPEWVREKADEARKQAEALAAGERALLVLAPLSALFRKAKEDADLEKSSYTCSEAEVADEGFSRMERLACAGALLVDGAMTAPSRKKEGGLVFGPWPPGGPGPEEAV